MTMTNPKIVDHVSDLLGDNVIGWGAHFFCKMPGDVKPLPGIKTSYWPLTPSKGRHRCGWPSMMPMQRNACMKFIAGSHHHGHMTYRPSDSADHNVLNQTIDNAEQYGEVVWNPLPAGWASIHSDLLLHGSMTTPPRAGAAH